MFGGTRLHFNLSFAGLGFGRMSGPTGKKKRKLLELDPVSLYHGQAVEVHLKMFEACKPHLSMQVCFFSAIAGSCHGLVTM